MLPNANPAASGGKMTPEMMMLSMQESTLNYTQGMYEKLDNILTFLKVDDKEDDLRYQKEQNAKIEEGRETKRNAGSGLRGAATAVKDKALEIGKGMSLGGVLSTLLGGALLAAIFAPDKFDKMVGQIKELSSTVLDSNFFKGVAETAWGIIKKNLELDNLFVSAIFGWRAGAIYSAFDYMGEKLVESMGLKVIKGDDTGTGEVQLGQKIENFIAENLPLAFGAAGLFAALFPGKFFKGIGSILIGLGSFIVGPITQAAAAIADANAAGPNGTLPADVVSTDDQKKIKDSKKQIAKRMLFGAGQTAVITGGLMGLFWGLGSLVGNVFEDGKIDGQDLTLENLGLTALSITSAVAAFAPALILKMLTALGAFLLSPAALPAILGGLAVAGIGTLVYQAFNTAQEDTVKRQRDKLVEGLTKVGLNEDEQAEFIKRVEESGGSHGEIHEIMKSDEFKEFDFRGTQIDQTAFFYKKEYDDLQNLQKAYKKPDIKSLSLDELKNLEVENVKKIRSIEGSLDVGSLAKVEGPVRKQLENEKQELEQQNQIIQKEIDERIIDENISRLKQSEDASGAPSTADTMLYTGGGDEVLGGSQGSDTLGATLSKPSHAYIDLMSAEIKVGSMAAQSSSMQPVVIDSSSNPSFVNNSQTMVNASRTSIYESMRETFSLESAAGRRFSAFA